MPVDPLRAHGAYYFLCEAANKRRLFGARKWMPADLMHHTGLTPDDVEHVVGHKLARWEGDDLVLMRPIATDWLETPDDVTPVLITRAPPAPGTDTISKLRFAGAFIKDNETADWLLMVDKVGIDRVMFAINGVRAKGDPGWYSKVRDFLKGPPPPEARKKEDW